MGFNADIDITGAGAGSSLSVNGGKTNLNADYKAVGEQSGIFANEADLVVEGKGRFIGGVFVTSEEAQANGKSNIVFKQGIEAEDIQNTSSYDGDAISVGVSLGNTDGKPQANMNGIGYGADSDSNSSITKGGVSGYNDEDRIFTTENRDALAGKLDDVFDAEKVNEELDAQTQITQAFDQERRKVKTEINIKEKKLRDEAEEARGVGDYETAIDKTFAANELQNQGLLFDAISGAIHGPNSNGATGYVAKAASPFVASQIGDYFKTNRADNKEDGGNRLEPNSPAHILAQGILGAAISYATGNDALTGGISASTGEATAPVLSKFLYGSSDPTKLTAEQKDTISAITSAVGLTIGATTGSASDAANAAETSKVAVEDNHMGGDRNKTNKQLAEDTRKMNERTEEILNALPSYLKNSKLMKNKEGDLIWCLPSSNHSCAPSSELKLATNSEIESAAKSAVTGAAISYVGGLTGGYVLKYAGKAVGTYKTIKQAQKAAEDSVRKARVKNNNQIDDDLGNRPLGGEHRANQYSQNWAKASLREVREKFAGKNPIITHTESGKIIHENRDTGIQVVYDKEGDYFTLIDPSIKGTRKYLDLNGNVPSEKTLPNGKKTGRSKSEYREVTHFKVDR